MAFLLSNIAAKAAEERKKKEAQPKDGGFFLANAASEAAAKRPTREPEPAPAAQMAGPAQNTQAQRRAAFMPANGGTRNTAQQTEEQTYTGTWAERQLKSQAAREQEEKTQLDKRRAALTGSHNMEWQPAEKAAEPIVETIPGTNIPVDSERGKALATLVEQLETTKNAMKLVPGNINNATTRAAQEYLMQGSEYLDFMNGFESDEQYAAYLDQLKAAQQEDLQLSSFDDAEARRQLELMYQHKAELEGQGNSDYVNSQLALVNKQIADLEGTLGKWENNRKLLQYSSLANAEGFETNSGYESQYNKEDWKYVGIPVTDEYGNAYGDMGSWINTGDADELYEYINGNPSVRAMHVQNAASASGDALNIVYGVEMDPWQVADQMTDEEKSIFNYIYKTRGKDDAHEYFDFLKDDLNRRNRLAEQAKAEELGKQHPLLASLMAIAYGPTKMTSLVGQGLELAATGDIDKNAPYNKWSYMPTTMQSTVSQEVEKVWGKPGTYAYDIAMSMANNLYNMAVSGGFGEAGAMSEGMVLALMGSGAAADTVLAAKDRGLSGTQAYLLGAVNGLVEIVTEKIGFDNLYDNVVNGNKPALTKIISQILSEGSEEGVAEIADDLADILIAGMDSERVQRIKQYESEGYTSGQAIGKAFGDLGIDTLLAIAGGAVSGGFFGVGGAVLSDVNNEMRQYQYEQALGHAFESLYGVDVGDYEQFAKDFNDALAEYDNEARTAAEGTQIAQPEAVDTTETENAAQPVLEPQTQTETAAPQAEPVVTPEQRAALERDAMAAMQKAVSNSFGKAGAEAAMSAYDPQSAVNTMDYLREFTSIYNAARNGTALPDHTNVLTKAQQEAAYTSGIADRAETLQTPAEKSTIEVTPAKRAQFEALQAADVQSDDFEAITAPEQIMTFAEAVQAAQGQKGQADFNLEDAQAALDKGEITVYSAGPIRTGSFVTPSRIVAQSMTNGRISSTTVPLDSVAWTDYAGGQYVGTEDIYNGGERNGILPGSSERNDRARAGEQAGELVGRAEEAQGGNGRGQAAAARSENGGSPAQQDTEQAVKHTADLGIKGGSTTDSIRLVTERSSEDIKRAQTLADEHGLKLVLFEGGDMHVGDTTARACITNGTIYARTDHPHFSVYQLVKHEVTHDLIDRGEIDENIVRERIVALYGEGSVQAVARLYASGYKGMTAEQAWTEMVCDAEADMNVFEKEFGATNKVYQKFLDDVKAASVNSSSTERGPPRGNKNYSIDADFEGNYDAWVSDGKPSGRHITVGTTPAALSEIGIAPKQVSWDTTKLNGIQKKHPYMTDAIIKQASTMIDDPVVVLTSKTQANRVVFLGNVYVLDENGRNVPVMAAVELLPSSHGYILDEYKVVSAYAREHPDEVPSIEATQRFIDSSRFLYINPNIKKTQNWLDHTGLRLPFESDQFGPIDKITLVPRDVKGNFTFGNTDKELQDWQKALREISFAETADKIHAGESRKGVQFSRDSSPISPEVLEEQNEQLRKDLQAATAALARAQSKAAYWEGQTKPSPAPSPDATDINRFAKYLVSTNATNLKAKDIAPALTEMAEYIMRGGNAQDELTFTGVKERAVDIAHNILQNYSELQDSTALSDYKEIRKHIRDWGTIRVPGNDLPPDFKDWKAAHRWLRVAVSTGTDIDMVYKDLSTSWPWIFPPDANYGSDQLYAIAEGVRAAEPAYWNPNDEMMAEATEYLANQIIDGLVNGYVDELGETVEMPIRQAHTYADRMEKKLADQKYDAARKLEEQKTIMQAAVRQARERSDQRLANLKAHYAEVQQNARQRKMESNVRTRLLKIARRLANKKLPTVSRALLNEYIGQLDLVAKNMTGKTREQLQALKDLYDEAVKENPDFKDDEFKAKIERLEKVRIADMTIEEVQDLTDVLLGLEHAFNTAKKELDSADRRDVYQKGMQIVADIEGGHQGNGRFEELKDKFVSNTLSPLRLIRMFTGYVDSDPLYATAKRLNDGQHTADSYVMQSSKKFNQWTENKEFMKRLTGKDASTITIRGVGDKGQPVEVEITPDMRLSLYLHSKNKQNMKHISSVNGGLTVPDMKLYKQGKISQAYSHSVNVRLTEEEVNSICANMTAQDRALADAIYKYFNETSREALNDVYERLKGYPMRVVENYFPIKSNSAYTKGADDNLVFDGTLEGAGWLKERVVNASNPIMLEDATSVLLRAIQSHGRFVGLSIPISDFNKLFKMSGGLYTEDGKQYGKVDVKKTLGETWGPRAEQHIKKILGDLQSTYSESNSWDDAFSKLRSLYAKATLELNLSVALKQAGSYPTALAVLGWKPLARALADFGKVDLDYIASMTPLQWLRSQGYSTPELGDLKKQGRQLPKALNWIQGMDLLTTRKLWKACEYYMQYNHADLQKGSDEYKATISELYNRVIEETQPNYTVMQRPELLRSDKGTWKGLMMFRTQLFQNFNIAADAYGNLMAKKRQYMANPTEETQASYSDAKKNAGRATSALIVQAVVIAAVTLGWNALRGKLKRYKDEDKDKITAGSFLKRFGTDFAGNIFSMIPFGGEAFSLVSSAWTGDKWYGFESVDATMLTDIFNAFGTAVTQIGKSLEAAQSGQTAAIHKQVLAWESIAESGAKMFGVPASNVMNLIKAVYGSITKTACGKYYGEYLSMLATTPIEGNKGQYYDLLYKAQQENPEAFWEIYNSLVALDAMASEKKSTVENIDAALKQREKKNK